MLSDEFNPAKMVVLEKSLPLSAPNDNLGETSVELIKDETEAITYSVSSDLPSVFVLTDTYYPGWQARVDGKETEILRANLAFRAIPLTSGKHLVEFEYKPYFFYWGVIISAITIVSLIFYSFWAILPKKLRGKIKDLFLRR